MANVTVPRGSVSKKVTEGRNFASAASAATTNETTSASPLPKKIEPAPEEGFDTVEEWYAFIRNSYKGIKPPKREYLTALIEACSEKKHLGTAKATMELYHRKKQPVTRDQSNLFVNKCCDLGAADIAYGIFLRKRHSPIDPSNVSPESLIRLTEALSAEEKVDECLKLNSVAKKLDMERNDQSFKSVVQACVANTSDEAIKRVFEWDSPQSAGWWNAETLRVVLEGGWEANAKEELKPVIELFLEGNAALQSEEVSEILSGWVEKVEVEEDAERGDGGDTEETSSE
eukprot:g2367.t1